MNLNACVEYWLRDVPHCDNDYLLQDDSQGAGPYIGIWNEVKLGAQPTLEQLQAIESNALAWQDEQQANDTSAIDWTQDARLVQMATDILVATGASATVDDCIAINQSACQVMTLEKQQALKGSGIKTNP